jgi:hypothetical protein
LRHPLQEQLLAAWEQSIEEDYCKQRINSERSLQASVWSKLNSILTTETRRMFIEPRFTFTVDGETKHRYPDIVICNRVQVIAVIELKYQPRVSPTFKKDLETLQLISRYRQDLRVANSRFRGSSRDAKEPKSTDESNERPMFSDKITELDGCFLELHAETDVKGRPKVFRRFR